MRGLPVDDAIRVLQLCEKDAADRRAEAARLGDRQRRAQQRRSRPTSCSSSRVWADEGPTRKYGQPRARGRYFRIRKRTSHVTIVLERYEVDELETRRRREETSGSRCRGRAAPALRACASFAVPPEPEPDAVDVERAGRAGSRRGRPVGARIVDDRDDESKPTTDETTAVDEPSSIPNRPPTSRKPRRTNHGSKSQPVRVPPRHHHRLEVALDRRQEGIHRVPHRGLEDPRLLAQAARARRGQPRRDRAHA